MKVFTSRFIRNYTWLLILFISLGFQNISAQEQSFILKGRVADIHKVALPGVNVVLKENNTGSITDSNGDFELKVSKGQSLIFSFVGYSSKQIIVSGSGFLLITLEENTELLSDVVVIGYGKVQKKDLTGSIESLSNKELMKAMTPNVTEALNGRISGVLVTKASNRPGADMSVHIRGANSFNFSNEPLYVIDGVPS